VGRSLRDGKQNGMVANGLDSDRRLARPAGILQGQHRQSATRSPFS